MGHIKKRLIFHFYSFANFRKNYAIQLHLKCLKHYSSVFDEALFIISVDNINDNDLILETQIAILQCGFKNVQFKIHENNLYYEAEPFYNEVISKLDILDGLTFWGHTKGTTNVLQEIKSMESLEAWILGMYFLNLQFIEEVEWALCVEPHRFYGTFLTDLRESWAHCYLYPGTFYWLNCPGIWRDLQLKMTKAPVPTSSGDRGVAEYLPGLLYTWTGSRSDGLYSHNNAILYPYDAYFSSHEALDFLLKDNDDKVRYEEFKKAIGLETE